MGFKRPSCCQRALDFCERSCCYCLSCVALVFERSCFIFKMGREIPSWRACLENQIRMAKEWLVGNMCPTSRGCYFSRSSKLSSKAAICVSHLPPRNTTGSLGGREPKVSSGSKHSPFSFLKLGPWLLHFPTHTTHTHTHTHSLSLSLSLSLAPCTSTNGISALIENQANGEMAAVPADYGCSEERQQAGCRSRTRRGYLIYPYRIIQSFNKEVTYHVMHVVLGNPYPGRIQVL